MKINFKYMQLTVEKLETVLKELNNAKERLAAERMRLSCNSELESVIVNIRETENRICEQIIAVMKMKAAIIKISYIYNNGEEQIKSVIDCGCIQEKQGFKNRCAICNNTDFEWSIQ